jgi:hypothetical protein
MRYALLTVALVLTACFAPPGPMEKLTNNAYELNTATRFGRMDVALSMVAEDAQNDFMRRHADWHGEMRIVDLEMRGMRMTEKDVAEVQLSVTWHRIDQTTIHSSVISQRWTQTKNGWFLSEETRVGGAPGLFTVPKGMSGKKKKIGKRSTRPFNPSDPPPAMDGLTISDWQ